MDAWWIDEPVMLGSGNPSTDDLAALRARGFRVVVSLLDEEKQQPRYDLGRVLALGYTRRNIPVRDFRAPTVTQLCEFVGFVSQLESGAKVVVHCQAGIGRTGTFGAAWLISRGMPAAKAIEKLREARPGAVETDEQRQSLEEFAKTCSSARAVR